VSGMSGATHLMVGARKVTVNMKHPGGCA